MPKHDATDHEVPDELRSFEPLRFSLAIGALLLGVILGFH